jgi:hypothetical protein
MNFHDVMICVTTYGEKEKFEDTVYRRRTDNTMAKRKSTKEQTTIYKTYI